MIYNLNEKFTEVKETEGVLENKSSCFTIELVVSDNSPEKDTGIELQPKEKMPFSLETGKKLYARCTNLDGVMANLAVVNFNLPASGSSGAGEKTLWSGSVGTTGSTVVTNIIPLSDSLANYRKFGVLFTEYSSINTAYWRPQYREFTVSQLQDVMANGINAASISCIWGWANTEGYSDIQATSSLTSLDIKSKYSLVKEIRGIY
jgi:hypothetical protein